jgi:uncharacterized surface protein with fasciclin (FAS1) repeats
MKFVIARKALAVVTMAATLAGTSLAVAADKDIVDTAVGAGSFKTLAAALQAAGLVDALKGEGPFTVFAPTDEAFAKLPKGTVETLLKPENKDQLIGVLTYHVVKGKVPAAEVVKLTGAKTLNGQLVDIKVADGKVTVDKANVVTTDIACSNGIIHVIDSVILPASDDLPTTAVKAETFKTLVAAAKAAGLVDALAGEDALTVFAPTDEAFAKLPAGTVETLLKPENKDKLVSILTYHVVPGRVYSMDAVKAGKAKTLQGAEVKISVGSDGAKVNDAKILATDIDASNGVIHVIDSVILPPEGKTSAVSAKEEIEVAIRKGAPLYNAGHHGECAKIYMSTVAELVEGDCVACPSTRAMMQTALEKAQHTSCMTSQAWILRNAMDTAYKTMTASR